MARRDVQPVRKHHEESGKSRHRGWRWIIWSIAILLFANLLYAGKSLLGLDLDPSHHHGNLFPLGSEIYDALSGPSAFHSLDGPYKWQTNQPGDAGHENGDVAVGWIDNSTWGPAWVRYSCDLCDLPHHRFAQKIEALRLGPGAACQFAQRIRVRPKVQYLATMTLKSNRPINVTLEYRCLGAPYRVVRRSTFLVGKAWRVITLSGAFSEADVVHNTAMLMVLFKTPSTVWIGDATLHPLDGLGSKPQQKSTL